MTDSVDLLPFTTEDFNAVTYLNRQLPPANPDTYYASATTLLPSLDLLARNTHSELTSTLSTLLRSSTRLGIDMDTLAHDTRNLSSQIPRIQNEVSGLQLDSGVMSELSLLEVVQERIQQTLDIFNVARQWNTQVDEGMRFQIDSGAYENAEQRIAELKELVGIWEGTNEFKERMERVQSLERALANARRPASPPTNRSPLPSQRGHTRQSSRLRVESTDGIIRESGGQFGQLRQNIIR